MSQTCLYEAERRERVRREPTASPAERKPAGCTLPACVRVCFACMSACVSALTGKLVNTFLGTKLCQPVLLGNVQTPRGTGREGETGRRVGLNARTEEPPVRARLSLRSKLSRSNRGDLHTHQPTGGAAGSLSRQRVRQPRTRGTVCGKTATTRKSGEQELCSQIQIVSISRSHNSS